MAGNGGQQPTYGPVTDDTYKTAGGRTDITQGVECDAIQATYQGMAVRTGPLSNEDDSHVQGVYAEQDFAGS